MLLFQHLYHVFRQCFVVLSRVSAVGKHLCQSLLLVYFHKPLVLCQFLLAVIIFVNLRRRIWSVDLVVYDSLYRQSVGQWWFLVRPANSQRCYRHDEFGQFESLDNHLWHVHRSAEIAQSESGILSEVAKCLGEKQCV